MYLFKWLFLVFCQSPEDGENEIEFDDDCSPKVPIVGCEQNYCKTSTCPNYPNAECRLSLCGECKPVFYVGGQKVNCYSDGNTGIFI